MPNTSLRKRKAIGSIKTLKQRTEITEKLLLGIAVNTLICKINTKIYKICDVKINKNNTRQ